MKRLCTILARGGSKGVVDKNIRPLFGKPLIAHSILQAKTSGLFDVVACSSDSEAILRAARDWGADLLVRRPAEMATDQAPKIAAVQHCLREAEGRLGTRFETLTDLDPTAPLRRIDDIRNAVRLLEEKRVSNVITGTRARKSPYFNLVEVDGGGIARLSKKPEKPMVRRQDAPACFDMNASIYVWRREALLGQDTLFFADTLLYEMDIESRTDIDSEIDFEIVELIGGKRGYFEENKLQKTL